MTALALKNNNNRHHPPLLCSDFATFHNIHAPIFLIKPRNTNVLPLRLAELPCLFIVNRLFTFKHEINKMKLTKNALLSLSTVPAITNFGSVEINLYKQILHV